MADDEPPHRLRALPGAAGAEAPDHRVAAVLEVLAGASAAEVAARSGTDVALVRRWVRGFVDAGSAQVTNVPLGDAARQRDRFLAAFAHELRTPLTVARGWAGMLADAEVPPAAVGRTAERLQQALDRLGERLEDVELLASASLGRLRLDRRPISAGELVSPVDGPGELGADAADVLLDVDPDQFRRVLRDLWAAAHLPPEPRSVEIEVDGGERWVEMRVVRHADPIDPPLLQALFEPFDLNDDGTGVTMGIYLARALVVAHGGTLGIDQDDDRGCFWVRVGRTLRA